MAPLKVGSTTIFRNGNLVLGTKTKILNPSRIIIFSNGDLLELTAEIIVKTYQHVKEILNFYAIIIVTSTWPMVLLHNLTIYLNVK